MQITNLRDYSITLGFVEPFGITLEANSILVIDDKYSSNASFALLKSNGDVRIDGFNSSSTETESQVSPLEFNTFAQGLFQISDTWSSSGSITQGTPYMLRGTIVGPFDLNTFNSIKFLFDSLYTVEVTLPKTVYSLAGLVDELNKYISNYAVASIYNTYYLQIASKSVGPNSKVEIQVTSNDCSSLFGLTTTVLGTGDIATVTFRTLNPTGYGIQGTEHAVKLYDEHDSVTSELQIQRVTVGIPFHINLAECTIETGVDGVITFEVGAPSAISNLHNYVDVAIPSLYFLAKKPTSKLQIR